MKELKHAVCPNCEQEFDSIFEFCPHCGQRNKKLELSLNFFLHDFLSSSFNLDSKIFQTLKLLIFYPGKLTSAFLEGKRTSYLPPVRLYLVISLVYFTVLSFTSTDIVKWNEDTSGSAALDSAAKQMYKDSVINSIPDSTETIKTTDSTISKGTSEELVLTLDNIEDWRDVLKNDGDTLADSAVVEQGKWESFALNRFKKMGTEEGKKAFGTLLQKYISIGMFILMPITALLFFMLFYRNTFYIQHLVFVLHLQSLMYILFIVLNLLELFVYEGYINVATFLLFFFILGIWIKKFYKINWGRTIWKTMLFLLMYGICFALFFVVVAGISAWNL